MFNSPLLQSFCALLIGLLWNPFATLAGATFALPLTVGWAVLSVFSVLYARYNSRGRAALRGTTLAGCVLLGAVVRMRPPAPHDPGGECEALLTGTVDSGVEWQESLYDPDGEVVYASFYLRLRAVRCDSHWLTGPVCRARCTIVSSAPLAVKRGDMITCRGRLGPMPRATNPGQFDMAAHFLRLGVTHRVLVRRGTLRWCTPRQLPVYVRVQRRLDRLRARLAARLAAPPDRAVEGRILRRMLLGTREALPEEMTEVFARTGTFHIVAISGLHIGIVWGLCWAFLWSIGVPGRYRAGCVLPLLWAYAAMVGLRPSVVRAMLMFTGLAFAPLARRPHSAAQVLLAVAFCYLVYNAAAYASFGTLLTFLSVCSLLGGASLLDHVLVRIGLVRNVAVYDFEHRHHRYTRTIARYVLHIACATGSIWLLTWPITLTRNNLVTPGAWLANLLVVPMLSIVLGLGFAAMLLAPLTAWLARVLLTLSLELLHGLVVGMEAVACLPGSYFAVPCLTAPRILCYYAALVLTWAWARRRVTAPGVLTVRMRLLGAAAGAAWLVFLAPVFRPVRAPTAMRIVCLDVGLGDAAVIHTPSGGAVLVDGGTRFGAWSQGRRVVLPYLRYAGVNSLDAVVCSHFDRDHSGGLLEVLEGCRVRAVYVPPRLGADAFAEHLRQVAAQRGAAWRTWHAGVTQQIGALALVISHPPAVVSNFAATGATASDNMWSLVVRAECDGRSALFTGDATAGAEALQIAAGRLAPADVLKVAHHGSRSSTSARLLDAVDPALGVISVGGNHMGLPAPAVLKRLARHNVRVVRTDVSGALELTFHTNEITVRAFAPSDGAYR